MILYTIMVALYLHIIVAMILGGALIIHVGDSPTRRFDPRFGALILLSGYGLLWVHIATFMERT